MKNETHQLPAINIIVPLYNEEENFGTLTNRLINLMNDSVLKIEVILVDDGSNDSTALMMKQLSLLDQRFHSIFLSRNFGHQLALSAGLKYANAKEAVFIIDGDLQDPPELLDHFYSYYKQGYDVVYAVRNSRESSLFLKLAYYTFYRIMKRFSYINIPLDSGDFSLISRRVVDQIINMPEESRFLRGLRSWVGFKEIGIPYDRESRKKGTSKYGLFKLIGLALNGIFNFSKYPIRFTMMLGIVALLISLIYFLITLFKKLFIGDVPTGFTALLFAIILFGGLQLVAIGIIGEYVLKIFFQVKNRPLFIIKERIQYGDQVED